MAARSLGKFPFDELLYHVPDDHSGKMLNCKIHTCPQRCHQLQDHSKMDCNAIITSKCPQNHKLTRKCHNKAAVVCKKCEAEARAIKKRQERDYKLDQERQAKQQIYASQLAEIEGEIEHQQRILRDRTDEQARQNALAQKKQDLSSLRKKAQLSADVLKPQVAAKQPVISPVELAESNNSSSNVENHIDDSQPARNDEAPEQDKGRPEWDSSEAKDDWQEQKELWGAENEALDSLMSMIGKYRVYNFYRMLIVKGLESVKEQFLAIKNKVDTLVRQNVPLSGERLGAALLGNPGTGMLEI